jgi:hypothetical protein
MSKKVVAFEATIDASGAEGSVKSLKAQLREAQADVQALSDKFGATSEQAVNAAKKAAGLKDAIGDAKALTDAFNPDAKFKAFGAAIKGVAGGFAALQGAQALFGSKSQELEKTLAKVQGAMALSQGIDSVLEAKDSFVRLGAVVKDNVIKGFNGLKAAIGGTGIGLLVIGLGLLIANFDKVKKVVENLFPGFAKLGSFITGIVNKITDFVGITSEAQRATDKLIASNKKESEATDRYLKFNADKYDEYSLRKIKANNEFKKNQNEILENDKLNDKQKQDLIKQAREFANREIAGAESDRQAKAKEIREKQAEERKKEKEQKAAEKERDDKEAAQKEKERLDNIAAQNKATDELILRNRIQSIKDEFQRKQFEISVNQQKEIDAQIELLQKGLITQEEYNQRKALIDENYKQQEKDSLDAHNKTIEEKNKASKDKQAADDIAAAKAVADQKKAIQDAEFGALDAGVGFLSAIAGKSKALQKAAIIAEGAIGIAKMVTANQAANIGALATPQAIATSGAAAAPVIAFNNIKTALSIATTIAATAKALSALGGGGGVSGAGGGGGGTTAPVQPGVATTTINQGQVNQLASATSRAFVLESDVSGNQERIERLNRAARIN